MSESKYTAAVLATTLGGALALGGCASEPQAIMVTVEPTAPSPSQPQTTPSESRTETIAAVDTSPRDLLRDPAVSFQIAATKTAPDSTNAAGDPVSYPATNMVDGEFSTAWRVPFTNEWWTFEDYILITFTEPVVVTSVGLVPGYAKVDPVSGADRFVQNRRIELVRWEFSDDYNSWRQVFVEEPTMQTAPVFATTQWVKINIGRVFDRLDEAEREYVAISEISIVGYPAPPE